MSDLGGEPACWAHLADDLDLSEPPSRVVQVDAEQIDDAGSGAVWSLPHDGDLDANLIQLASGQEIALHVNHELDVLVIVWQGTGELVIDDDVLPVRPGVATLVPRGSARAVRAGPDGMRYFTVHRRRGPLTVGRH